ncbi:hypothetical protein [Microbulbifer agarilyticus]|uniref:hypothetical protein n=1 Tax=Microbulbifer agarilyticus TaxID=260552 RepID=UPI001C95357F|nr:hypothetical protein [Microbulbifer agarilyticus]MBY6212676.1 hypothetical protein [Microbulbifer agarilyticus]MCA0894291.1 hypothetical protein [Microbulbifer agarilyticus]
MGYLQATQSAAALKAWGQRGPGRSIFASGHHRKLLDNFQQLSTQQSSEGYHAQSLVKAVDSLRGAVSPVNSMLKPKHPTRRLLVAGGFEIEYELNSYYGDCQTDVEIVDIRLLGDDASDERRPALWRAKYEREWRPEVNSQPELTATETQTGSSAKAPLKLGINGQCENLRHSLQVVGEHISRGDSEKREGLKKSGFQLVYVPPESGAWAAGWRTLKSLGNSGSEQQRLAARIVAGHMLGAHQQRLHVEWTSQGEGAWVLIEAMQHLKHQNIDLEQRQKIFLSDHTRSQFEADRCRRALNMNIGDEKWHSAAGGLPQEVGGRNFGLAPLLSEGNELIHHTPRGERLGQTVKICWELGDYLVKKWGTAGTAAGLAVATGGNAALAVAVVKALHMATPMLISSLPGARDHYFKSTGDQLRQMINNRNKR